MYITITPITHSGISEHSILYDTKYKINLMRPNSILATSAQTDPEAYFLRYLSRINRLMLVVPFNKKNHFQRFPFTKCLAFTTLCRIENARFRT